MYIYEYVIRTTEFIIKMKKFLDQNERLLIRTQICILEYVIRTTEFIIGMKKFFD